MIIGRCTFHIINPQFPHLSIYYILLPQNLLPCYIYFSHPVAAFPLTLFSPSLSLVSLPTQAEATNASDDQKAELEDGNGATPSVRGRWHGRLPLLLPLVFPGGPASAAPRERGRAEAEPCGDDAGAGGCQGGAEEEGAEHRQARRPGPPGRQGARRRARPAAAAPPRRRAAAARDVQRHRLRLQPSLLPRRPLLRPRHLRGQPQVQPRRNTTDSSGRCQAAAAAARRRLGGRRRARHARQQEAAAAEGEATRRGHGGGAPAAEPARRRPAPAVAQPADGARPRRAGPQRPRRWLRRPGDHGLRRRRQRLREAAGGVHAAPDAHGQLLAGIRRQARQAALTAPDHAGRRSWSSWSL